MQINIPYGKEKQVLNVDEANLNGILVSQIEDYHPEKSQSELVAAAIAAAPRVSQLSQLAIGKQKIVIIASDHTAGAQ